MHFAKLKNSARLNSILSLLRDGESHTTREIIQRTGACAINSAAAELRANNIPVTCRYVGLTQERNRIYAYQIDPAFAGQIC